jgi:hypothetical protein
MTTSVDAISTPLLIGGEERAGGAGTFPVYDPAQTGGIIGYAAAASTRSRPWQPPRRPGPPGRR